MNDIKPLRRDRLSLESRVVDLLLGLLIAGLACLGIAVTMGFIAWLLCIPEVWL